MNRLNIYQLIVLDRFTQLPLYRKFLQNRPLHECGDGIVCAVVFSAEGRQRLYQAGNFMATFGGRSGSH